LDRIEAARETLTEALPPLQDPDHMMSISQGSILILDFSFLKIIIKTLSLHNK